MQPEKKTTPFAFTVALFNILLGSIGLGASLLITAVPKGIGEMAIGCLLLGAGEYLNNPKCPQQLPASGTKKTTFKLSDYLKRRRNVCALGNLLDIAGVLMIFVGITSLFF
jgi:hypothetical protein